MLPQADRHSAFPWRAQDSTHAIRANPPLSAYPDNFCLPSTMAPSGTMALGTSRARRRRSRPAVWAWPVGAQSLAGAGTSWVLSDVQQAATAPGASSVVARHTAFG